MMKKMIFALLLSLGVSQVSTVVAVDGAKAEVKAGFIKSHKKALYIGLGALVLASGVMTLAYKYEWNKGGMFGNANAAACKWIVGKATSVKNLAVLTTPFGYNTKLQKLGVLALDIVAIIAIIELGSKISKKYPSMIGKLTSLGKSSSKSTVVASVAK